MEDKTPFQLYLIELRKLQIELETADFNNQEDKIKACIKELNTIISYGEKRFYDDK